MTTTFTITNGDVVLDRRNGRPVTVADREKVRQDVAETLSVERQPSGFGAGLVELSGRVGSPFALQAEIGRRVRQAIRALQVLQRRYHWAQRLNEERMLGIGQLVVGLGRDPKTGAESKTDFVFRVDVVTVEGSTVSVSGGT